MPEIVRYHFACTPRRVRQVAWSGDLSTWGDLRAHLMWELRFVYRLPGSGRLHAMSDIEAAREQDFRTSGRRAPRLAAADPVTAYELLVLFRVPPSESVLAKLGSLRPAAAEPQPPEGGAAAAVDTRDMDDILKSSAKAWVSGGAADDPRQAVAASLRSAAAEAPRRPRSNYVCSMCGSEGEHFHADCPLRRGEKIEGPIYRTPRGIPTYKLRRVSESGAQAFKLVFRKSDGSLWVERDAVPTGASVPVAPPGRPP